MNIYSFFANISLDIPYDKIEQSLLKTIVEKNGEFIKSKVRVAYKMLGVAKYRGVLNQTMFEKLIKPALEEAI